MRTLRVNVEVTQKMKRTGREKKKKKREVRVEKKVENKCLMKSTGSRNEF